MQQAEKNLTEVKSKVYVEMKRAQNNFNLAKENYYAAVDNLKLAERIEKKNIIKFMKFEFIEESVKNSLVSKGHRVTVEEKLVAGYGPISTIYKNQSGNFVGVPDVRVGTEKAFNNS